MWVIYVRQKIKKKIKTDILDAQKRAFYLSSHVQSPECLGGSELLSQIFWLGKITKLILELWCLSSNRPSFMLDAARHVGSSNHYLVKYSYYPLSIKQV